MGRDPAPLTREPLRCPFCGSIEVEIVAPWGAQMITCSCRCGSCRTYFEAIREDFADPVPE